MKGLIIKPFWCYKILRDGKVWEIRKTNTNIRGKIFLIASGTKHIVGETELINSFPLTKELFENNFNKHLINCSYEELPSNYKYVWELSNTKEYNKPKPYKHKQGAQIWINLEEEIK